ncbi:hypothetical protein [Pseudoalteromonas sp. MMG012]|uniref:hypothetical protein n=1 Tax=Pseudoalteromonas sp. MMG012 TaxID=2822686 RepID=UPI001B3A18E6|nr:hypothetical protein [Pseudoalteromonas sp. MMG012]MBQ4852774.1 hypothetical protein [Pseudoalteromonas sp. MMG012]
MKEKRENTLERNRSITDKFHKDLIGSVDQQNKVKISDIKSMSFYLPPIIKVQELLGVISNQKQLIDLLESYFEKPLKISTTNKYAIFKQGVGLRTVNKIMSWVKEIPFPWEKLASKKVMTRVIKSNRAGSNAGAWLSTISGFRVSYHSEKKDEFTPLFNFIEKRCSTEDDLILRVQKDVEAGKLKPNDIAAVWAAQQSLWVKNPYIPHDISENIIELMLKHQQRGKLTQQQTLDFIECYLYLFYDFYLEAITHFEIGCRMRYGTDQDKIENDLGMITKAINAYATQDDIRTCFAGILKEFRDALSQLGSETSFRKLASFIEINEAEPGEFGESKEDKQYKQLKDWRNGKNLPSNKKLKAFLRNIDEYAEKKSGSLTFEMCKIAMGIDRLVRELLGQAQKENCKQVDVEIVIKKVLSNIPNYYRVNLKAELERREPSI